MSDSLAPPITSRDIDAVVLRRTPGFALEGAFYVDEEIFELDIAAIFSRHWIFVTTEAEVPEPGDYVTVDLGPSSVIILRDDDEQIRALHNVCRHRGSRLLHEDRGSVGNIVCGYHQWTYAADGTLMHAGQQPDCFDKARFGLKQVAVRSVEGLVFICFDADAPGDFDDFAAKVTPYLAPHRLRRTKVAAQEELVVHGNWKLMMENNRECYHCEVGHPELTCTFFPTYGYAADKIPKRLLPAHARYLAAEDALERACSERGIPFRLIEDLHGRPTGYKLQREPLDGAGESYTRDGRAASRRLLGDLDTPRLGRLSMHCQPNSWFHFVSDHAITFTVLPLAVDRSLIRTTWLVHEDAVEGVDYDVATLTDVWHHTNEQDAVLVTRAHAGVGDPAYEPGPYAPNEDHVDQFVTWYLERLKEYRDR